MSESTKSFNQLGLSDHLLATLEELNFTAPTSVQEQAIPLVLEGKDVLAGAQTGTGKTAAFGLPIIQRLLATKDNVIPNPKLVRALVLVPTRELAQQVFDNVSSYAKGADLKVVVAYGGVSMKVQTDNLRQGADILVATPGRLIDHMFTKNIMLSQTEV